jgi:SNF2 family DNA or RNA helicase
VHAAMQPAVRFRREDVVELPPLSIIRREVEMSDLQRSTYNEVLRHLRAQVDAGEVSVANEAVKLMKLLQISSGFVYTNDRASALLDPEPRLEAIEEVIQEAQAKVLVFSPFIAGVDMIHERLTFTKGSSLDVMRTADTGGLWGKVTGAVSQTKRTEIFRAFTDGDMPGIVAHPATMSHGLNLHAADMIVWAAPYPSLEVYEQANARITRPGQTKKQLIVQISGSPVEARVYKRLDQRASMQNALLELFDQQDSQ